MTTEATPAAGNTNTAAAAGSSAAPATTQAPAVAPATTEGGQQAQQQTQQQNQQQKPTEAKDEGQQAKPEGVPEAYKFTAPDGFELDQPMTDLAVPIFKDLGLNQVQADKIVGMLPQVYDRVLQKNTEAWQERIEGWKKSVLEDKDLGGTNHQNTLHQVDQALAALGEPEFVKELTQSGYIHNPVFVKVLSKLFRDYISEDSSGGGKGNTPPAAKSEADLLFGDMPKPA